MSISVSKKVLLYHGSSTIVTEPKILTPNRPMDYGSGFYCTTSKSQAKKRAIAKTKSRQPAYVNIFTYDLSKFRKLKIQTMLSKLFPTMELK